MWQVLETLMPINIGFCTAEKTILAPPSTIVKTAPQQNTNRETLSSYDDMPSKTEEPRRDYDSMLEPPAKDVIMRNGMLVQNDDDDVRSVQNDDEVEYQPILFYPRLTESVLSQHERQFHSAEKEELHEDDIYRPIYTAGHEAMEQQELFERKQRFEEQIAYRNIDGFFDSDIASNVPVIVANTKRVVSPDSIEDMFKFQHRDALRGEAVRLAAKKKDRASIVDCEFH